MDSGFSGKLYPVKKKARSGEPFMLFATGKKGEKRQEIAGITRQKSGKTEKLGKYRKNSHFDFALRA